MFGLFKVVEDYLSKGTSDNSSLLEQGGFVPYHKYALGDKYRTNFDYGGLFDMAKDVTVQWSISDLKKLSSSLESTNYNTFNAILEKAIHQLENNQIEQADETLELFKSEISGDGMYANGGGVNGGGDSKYGNVVYEVVKDTKKLAKGGGVEADILKDSTPHLTNNNREEIQEKYNNSDKYNYTEFCDKCGRGIKGKPAFYIHMVAPDYVVPNDSATNELIDKLAMSGDIEDMGWYPIGSECVKAYNKKYHYPIEKYSKGGGVDYTKDWEVIYITYQGKKGKKIITLGRKSDKEDVKQALKRMDLNIREVTSIKEVNPKTETHYIEFLSAKDNFQKTKKEFQGKDSYNEAMEWGVKNIENFSSDMIHTKFAKGGSVTEFDIPNTLITETINVKMAKGGGVKTAKKLSVPKLHKKFSEEKKSIAINIITDAVANKLMHDNNKSVNFEELNEAEKKEFNEYYNKLYNATSKFLLKSFLERYYSDKDTREKCKGDGVKARDAIYSVVNEMGKAIKFFKFKSSKMADGGIIESYRLPASDTTPIGLGGIPTYNTPSDIELLRL